METYINVTDLHHSTRKRLAKKYAIHLDWEILNNKKEWILTVPGFRTGWTLVQDIEQDVREIKNRRNNNGE
jgi:hypothetical protein